MKSLIRKVLFLNISILIATFVFIAGCQQQKPDPSQELKTLVDKYIEVWNNGNLSELDAIMDSNYVHHSNQSPDVDIDDLKKVISGFRTAYPDVKLVWEDEIYSENKSAGRWIFTGTNTGPGEMPPTGKSVRIWGESILHYANGKITEEWTVYDNQSLMEQLGYTMMPPSGTNQ
ncbi:MAG: hypothetical protein A2V93_02605 [Ignavibacteria bacterium RBG_16_34_14]|nr:MAG: hypothetical protein A2V93_02605 [Ignavibacteria bacterium RBG_16_34_14]